MPLSFPSSPTAGDTYVYNGKLWYFDGTRWYSRYEALQVANTESVSIAVGTELQRPTTPTNGDFRINTTAKELEVYYNSTWYPVRYLDGAINDASGGLVSTVGNYKYHTWSSPGTYNFYVGDVPAGAKVEVWAWGAGGGGGYNAGAGGGGGAAYGELAVSSNTGYPLLIGGGGDTRAANSGTSVVPIGGGGNCGSLGYGGQGGGYTGIFLTTLDHANSLVIAGGGGGGAYEGAAGGAGGGENGIAGTNGLNAGGGGGTQTAGGVGGTSSGSALQGGTSAGDDNGGGGGGGGGYYGGGGGRNTNPGAAGGGGSGYFNPTYVSNATLYAGSGTTPGNDAHELRGTAGAGGASGANRGFPGKLVIRYRYI